MQNASGRRWAYFGVILGFAASITANIASTVLKSTEVPLELRVPFAVLWPLFTYVAIEVLVRIDWEGSWSHRLVRLVLAGPVGLVAAFVSYLHQHHLMVLAGEPGLAQGFGPLAVDGMLFGMTAALIVTRAKALPGTEHPYVPGEPAATQPIEPGIDWDKELKEMGYDPILKPNPFPALQEISPFSTAEVAPISAPPRTSSTWDARKVAEMAIDGEKTPQIVEATGAGRATVDRFRKVAKVLQANPRAEIDYRAEKLRPEYVTMMRELVTR